MQSEATVFVVDDDPGVRKTLGWLVESAELSAETYASAQEFLAAYDPERPGCVVLDVRLRGMSGLELLERLATCDPPPPVVMITAFGDFSTAVRALKAGAVDILQKPFSDQVLLERIWEAIARDRSTRQVRAQHRAVWASYEVLTPREREVLELYVEGRGTREIADELGLSVRTIEGYRTQIFEKMGVDSVTKLVRLILLTRSAATSVSVPPRAKASISL
jgi:FixJ family two-component response regulator